MSCSYTLLLEIPAPHGKAAVEKGVISQAFAPWRFLYREAVEVRA